MKKKLGALDVKIQIGLIVVLAVVLGFVGRMFLVNPQKDQATALQTQLDDVNTQIATRTAQAQSSAKPQPMEVADLFRLSKAIPDREDMPGIILTISQVARSAGISFDTIEPQDITPIGNYRARKLHLTFNGDFYSLSDFLYRVRNLVSVQRGRLIANGRLFSVEKLQFSEAPSGFPNIRANLTLSAFLYGSGPTAAPPAASTTTSTDTTSTDTTATTTPETPPATPEAAGAP